MRICIRSRSCCAPTAVLYSFTLMLRLCGRKILRALKKSPFWAFLTDFSDFFVDFWPF